MVRLVLNVVSCKLALAPFSQREILQLASEGARTADIAAQLRISAGTVRNYLSEAILKLGAENRIEAARIARGKGWL